MMMLARWRHNLVGDICSLHVALQQQPPRLLSAYLGCHGCLISSKLARLRTDSRILGMIRRHIIRLQMLSLPFPMKQRWRTTLGPALTIAAPKPRVSRDSATNATVQ